VGAGLFPKLIMVPPNWLPLKLFVGLEALGLESFFRGEAGDVGEGGSSRGY
jgi:hypothetical protein